MGACSAKEKKPAAGNASKPEEPYNPEPAVTNGNGVTKPAAPDGEPDLSQQGLLNTDAELFDKRNEFSALAQRFNQPASAEVIEATKKALEEHGFVVQVVSDGKAALDYITSLPKEGQTINSGGSRTLDEIRFKDWAKNQTQFKDFKAEALAAEAKGDWGAASAIRKQGSQADFFFSSLAAVTQDGSLMWGSLTGTRVSINAGTLVLVAGTQKIVKDEVEGEARMYQWQMPLESARARVVYKVPGSNLNEVGTLRRVNPFAPPGSVHVVLVNGVWGF